MEKRHHCQATEDGVCVSKVEGLHDNQHTLSTIEDAFAENDKSN
jgi:hypothetical protein